MIFESIHSGPKAIQELVIKIEVKNSGKKGDEIFLFLSGFLVIELIKWLLQAISCGKLGTLNQPGLKKIFFLQRCNPRSWSSEVNQQFGGFYRAEFLRCILLRLWIFLFKISNINNKSCPGWPGITPQSLIITPENPRFSKKFQFFFFKIELFKVFNS